MKKVLALVMSIVLLVTLAVPAFAKENSVAESADTISSTQFSLDRSQLTPEERQNIDYYLSRVSSGLGINNLEVGELREVGEIGGDKLYVEIVEEQKTSLFRGYDNTSTTTFHFKYVNISGQTKDAFWVTLTCNWYSNGADSYIKKLTGKYIIKDNSFSCSWGPASDNHADPTYHAIYMDAYHNGESDTYLFGAMLDAHSPGAPILDLFYD